MDELLRWCANNCELVPQGAEMRRDDALVPYRKAKIADLTGIEKQKRKAKFIYDLYHVSVSAKIEHALTPSPARRRAAGSLQSPDLQGADYQDCLLE